MLGFLGKFLLGGGVQAIGDTVAKFTGDKVQQEGNRHEEVMAFEDRVTAETMAGYQRTSWWDSFVDGINRLVRPVFTFGTAGLFVWAAYDPITFTASMTALQLIPDPLWVILGTVVVFWFGGRALEGLKAPAMDPAKVKTVMSQIQQIRAMAPAAPVHVPDSATPVVTPELYKSAMQDVEKPLENSVILEWNRRRRQGQPT
ncbi:MAG TPA: 3TM-type holin [Azospirillaceae bacterium]|nr:3TM-type holin [Azospirillaceae bacterium]